MAITTRSARPEDVDRAVPSIYSSGPDAFDFVFGDAHEFLRSAFIDGSGEFGYHNHTVAVDGNEVVGIGAAYSGDVSLRFTLAIARQILQHFRLTAPAVIVRGLRLERVIRPPGKAVQYIGHLGVDPKMRSQGVGTRLVEHFLEEGRNQGLEIAELDVAATNPRAEELYKRLGFRVTDERESSLQNTHGRVANHRRMVLEL